MLGASELDTILQVGFHKNRINSLTLLATLLLVQFWVWLVVFSPFVILDIET